MEKFANFKVEDETWRRRRRKKSENSETSRRTKVWKNPRKWRTGIPRLGGDYVAPGKNSEENYLSSPSLYCSSLFLSLNKPFKKETHFSHGLWLIVISVLYVICRLLLHFSSLLRASHPSIVSVAINGRRQMLEHRSWIKERIMESGKAGGHNPLKILLVQT
jgi:hypothetical protein